MGNPDSGLAASMLRWQILQSLSTFAKCNLSSATPHSRSTSTEHSDTQDSLPLSETPTISVSDPLELIWSSSDLSPESEYTSLPVPELRRSPHSSTLITWDFSMVVIVKTQKENLHVMCMWCRDHECPHNIRLKKKKKKTKLSLWERVPLNLCCKQQNTNLILFMCVFLFNNWTL